MLDITLVITIVITLVTTFVITLTTTLVITIVITLIITIITITISHVRTEISVLRRPSVDGVMNLLAPNSSGVLAAQRALVPQIVRGGVQIYALISTMGCTNICLN